MIMLRRVLDLLNHSIFGRTVGSLSCVAGLLCYALSSSFKSLFGEWNPTKIVLYIILSSVFSVIVFFEAKSRVSVVSKLKPHVEFLVLMLTSLYSFFADRSTKGKPDTWSVVSSVAFALTSLCLSRQIRPGFDVGLFSFFLGCVTVQLMKIHLIFILVAAGFCYPLVVLGSYSESQSENGESSAEESVEIRIDDANRASFGMGQDEEAGQISSRRRDDDRRARSRSGKGGFSPSPSSDPLLARLPAHGNKSFQKLPEVAPTEQFLWDLQELKRPQQPWHQQEAQRLREQERQRLQLQQQRQRSSSGSGSSNGSRSRRSSCGGGPLILPEHVSMRVEILANTRSPAWASFDGKNRQKLEPRDALVCSMAPWPVPIACLVDSINDFLRSIHDWNLRKRQPFDGPHDT
ncbi:hypothetical protein K1719_043183 [Acacia pycnantha]|nr:hypothetical protein K1719_043183 [Acacia pycnantha]